MRPLHPSSLLVIAALATVPAVEAHAKPSRRAAAESSAPGSRAEADARAAMKRGDLQGAAAVLRKAREADSSPAPSLVLLHAQIYAKLGDSARAMRAYQDYLRVGGANAPNRGEAVARIQDYSSEVGALLIRVKPDGARVLVDGELVGTAPLSGSIPVSPGTHVVTLQGSNVKKSVQVKGDASVTVELEGPPSLAAAPAPAAIVAAPPEPTAAPPPVAATRTEPEVKPDPKTQPDPKTRPDLDVPPTEHALSNEPPKETPQAAPAPAPSEPSEPASRAWIGWTATGVLAAGAIASGFIAAGAVDDYQSKKETLGVTRDDLESAQGTAKLWSGLAIGLGAAAVTTAAITLFTQRSPKDKPAEPAVSATLRVSPGFVGVGGAFR